jgi:hypothetical protein
MRTISPPPHATSAATAPSSTGKRPAGEITHLSTPGPLGSRPSRLATQEGSLAPLGPPPQTTPGSRPPSATGTEQASSASGRSTPMSADAMQADRLMKIFAEKHYQKPFKTLPPATQQHVRQVFQKEQARNKAINDWTPEEWAPTPRIDDFKSWARKQHGHKLTADLLPALWLDWTSQNLTGSGASPAEPSAASSASAQPLPSGQRSTSPKRPSPLSPSTAGRPGPSVLSPIPQSPWTPGFIKEQDPGDK